MDGDTDHSDVDLCAKLVTTSEPVSGTTIGSSIGSKNDNPGSQLRYSKRKHGARGQLSVPRECDEDENTVIMTDIDSFDEINTANPPPKRARFAENVVFRPKTDPSTQHIAILEPAHNSRQLPSASQQRLPPASQPTQPLPAQDMQEQSRQIHRILTCPPDAYFDILSLANGTDRLSLVEMSWLDLSYLVHPRRCSFPGAVEALCRVNDAYSWIQKHPGMSQPHVVIPPPPPYLAQDAPSDLAAWLAPSTSAKRIIEEPQKTRDSSGKWTHPTQQRSESRRGATLPISRGHTVEVPQQSQNISSNRTQPTPQHLESHLPPGLGPSTSRGRTVKEEPQLWDSSGICAPPAPPQSESRPSRQIVRPNPSGHTIKGELQSSTSLSTQTQHAPHRPVSWDDVGTMQPPPRWTYHAMQSSHVYVISGKPTIRPAVGWQFRKLGTETRVWWQGRWRPLIQNRPEFEGVYIDDDGWIMPILSSDISESKRTRIQQQAKFEFNSHP